jgi:hypothetical protein
MTHTEGDSSWQFDPGSFDIDSEEDDPSDYSKLLARESNSESAGEPPHRKELRRPLSRRLPGRVG